MASSSSPTHSACADLRSQLERMEASLLGTSSTSGTGQAGVSACQNPAAPNNSSDPHTLYPPHAWGWSAGLADLQRAAAGLGIDAGYWKQQLASRTPTSFPVATVLPQNTQDLTNQAMESKQQSATISPPALAEGPEHLSSSNHSHQHFSRQQNVRRQVHLPDKGSSAPLVSLKEVLFQSREVLSPHCAASLADALGLGEGYKACAASAVLPLPLESHLEGLRGALKQHVNSAWSLEAVKQGVAHAKTGQYDEAKRCYTKAIELQSDHADAYVARGAAYANEKDYPAAASDLRAALKLDPGNANAKRYLEAVMTRAAKEGVSLNQHQNHHQNHPEHPHNHGHDHHQGHDRHVQDHEGQRQRGPEGQQQGQIQERDKASKGELNMTIEPGEGDMGAGRGRGQRAQVDGVTARLGVAGRDGGGDADVQRGGRDTQHDSKRRRSVSQDGHRAGKDGHSSGYSGSSGSSSDSSEEGGDGLGKAAGSTIKLALQSVLAKRDKKGNRKEKKGKKERHGSKSKSKGGKKSKHKRPKKK